MEALAEHLLVAGDHGADQRVRADPAAALLGELDRASEMAAVGIGLQGHGRCAYRIGRARVNGPLRIRSARR